MKESTVLQILNLTEARYAGNGHGMVDWLVRLLGNRALNMVSGGIRKRAHRHIE